MFIHFFVYEIYLFVKAILTPIRIKVIAENLFNQLPIAEFDFSLTEKDPAKKVSVINHNKPINA